MKQRFFLLIIYPVLLLGDLAIHGAYLYWVIVDPARSLKMAVAEDGEGNVGIGGKLGRTISAHAARSKAQGKRWGCLLCGLLDDIDPGPPAHCERALVDPEQNLKG